MTLFSVEQEQGRAFRQRHRRQAASCGAALHWPCESKVQILWHASPLFMEDVRFEDLAGLLFRDWFQTHRGLKKPTLRQYTRGAADLLQTLGEDV